MPAPPAPSRPARSRSPPCPGGRTVSAVAGLASARSRRSRPGRGCVLSTTRENNLTTECQAFRGTLATRVLVLRPRDPEAKGIIERAHDYLERSFLPGRTFTGPDDFNAQLQGWLDLVNQRYRRALECAPADRVAADTAAMLPLPPVPPATGWRHSTRLPRDFYVRLDSNDYSVHPSVIGRRIEGVADLDRVRAFCEGRLVADHPRVWARHQSLTEPEHDTAAKALRRERIDRALPVTETEVQTRDLNDYDDALGTGESAGPSDAGTVA